MSHSFGPTGRMSGTGLVHGLNWAHRLVPRVISSMCPQAPGVGTECRGVLDQAPDQLHTWCLVWPLQGYIAHAACSRICARFSLEWMCARVGATWRIVPERVEWAPCMAHRVIQQALHAVCMSTLRPTVSTRGWMMGLHGPHTAHRPYLWHSWLRAIAARDSLCSWGPGWINIFSEAFHKSYSSFATAVDFCSHGHGKIYPFWHCCWLKIGLPFNISGTDVVIK